MSEDPLTSLFEKWRREDEEFERTATPEQKAARDQVAAEMDAYFQDRAAPAPAGEGLREAVGDFLLAVDDMNPVPTHENVLVVSKDDVATLRAALASSPPVDDAPPKETP